MNDREQHIRALVAKLSEPARRERASRELAEALGAERLFGFLADPEIGRELVPAPGFQATLAGGPGWASLLEEARHPGLHSGEVLLKSGSEACSAFAYTHGDLALVFAGAQVDASEIDAVVEVMPLLESLLRAEHEQFILHGKLRVARLAAQQSANLAGALERTRGAREQAMAELEEQARKLEKSRETAEEALEVKDQFLAMLGHELRNPLAPIATATEVLRLKGLEASELDIIDRQVNHLTRLVDDLLDVSRITRGKIELRKECVELAEIVERGIEMASPLLEQKRQRLAVDIDQHLVVEVDPARFAQVISNLLTNAAKFSPPETTVSLCGKRDADHAVLSVIDEGVGIAPEELSGIFEHFVQNKQGPDRAQGGLGLGLAIVKSIVEMHSGEVWAHSDGVGCGAKFVVEVPVSEEALEAVSKEHRARRAPSEQLRILIVDDNKDAAELLAASLEAEGHYTCVALDGPAALDKVEQFQPDIGLLDIGLPVMDGYELAGRLRQCAGSRPLALVAVSGYGQQSVRERALEAGFDAHQVKPVDLPALKQLIETLASSSSSSSG